MNAAYRLMGNFPSRGFGDSLSSADFTSGASIVSGTDARLPMSGAPRTRAPQMPGEVTEAYHAYEIHPLSFGQLTVMYSATGAMMQANGAATRPCSYTNAVTWSGADVPAYVSSDAAMCSMLRYNDFVTLQELWVLPKDVSTLTAKAWVEDPSIRLEYNPPVAVSHEMFRSLLAHYWRAASLQFFGPWDSGKRMFCHYRDDMLLQHISNRDRNFSVSISREDDCQLLVPQARGFLWQMILKNLPRQIRNITSAAAAVPLQHAQSLYRDAAMCVVYPTAEAKFDFNTGKYPALEADEDRFMQQVLSGSMGALLEKMHTRYAALTGRMMVDECTFMADYDLALALYRLENAEDDWSLLANWYAVLRHLSQRHDIKDDMAAQVMCDVDAFVATRINGREADIAQMLTGQTDRNFVLMAAKLQAFMWEKSVYSAGAYCEIFARVTVICQGCPGAVFFPENPASQVIPENQSSLHRLAALVAGVLKTHHMEIRLSNQQVQQLLRITPTYVTSAPLHDAMAMYLAAYQNKHPEDRIRLLQLATQYLDADDQAAEALKMLTGRLDTPVTEEECKAIAGMWPMLKRPAFVQEELNKYIAALYVCYFGDLAVVSRIVTTLRSDSTGALVAIFTEDPGRTLQLNEQGFVHVMGQNATAECMLAGAQNLPAVEKAYRAYLQYQLEQSVQSGENLYGWIVRMINRSLPTRLYAKQQDRDAFIAWCTELVLDYTLDYALAAKHLPEEDSFSRLFKLAEQKAPLFNQRLPKVLDAYEGMLQAGAPNAERQAQQLAPYLTGIRSGTMLQQVTSMYISVLLQNEFQKANFWQVMNRKEIINSIQRTGALPKSIFDKETKQAAANCIRRELTSITQPLQYRTLFSSYASAENLFKRSISVPDFQTDTTISVMWHEVAAQMFLEQFEGFFQACESIDDTRVLMDVAEKTVGVRQKANECSTGRIIRRLIDAQSLLSVLPDEKQLFPRVVEKAASLRMTQSEKALQLMRHECDMAMSKETNFIRCAGIALLHSAVFNGYNWRSFLLKLQPEMDNMMHNPYAPGNLSLLAIISSVLKMFEGVQTQDNLLQNFVHFLTQDVNMAPYTMAVRKDQKAMAQFFPGRENSPSLRAWLGD